MSANDVKSDEPVIFREENLLKLESFCRALAEVLLRNGLAAEQAPALWRADITAQCTRCGAFVGGEVLYALSQPPAEEPGVELRRLRLGDCIQPGCESYFYRLNLRAHPPLAWPALLAEAAAIQGACQEAPRERLINAELAKSVLRLGLTRRAAIALAAVPILLLLRRLYTGGRIPGLREPEHFIVAPAPPGEPHPGEPPSAER